MSMPEDYRNGFIAQLHNALSGYTGFDVDEAVRYVVVICLWHVSDRFPDIQSKANQKQSASPSRLVQTIVYDLI